MEARRSVDLSGLPVKYDGNIDWVHSIGKTIPFTYEEISGDALITEYHYPVVTLVYGDNAIQVKTYILRHNGNWNAAKLAGRENGKVIWNYEIGQVLESQNNGKLLITDRFVQTHYPTKNGRQYTNHIKCYKYHCMLCGYDGEAKAAMLVSKQQGCPVCSGREVMRGVNDMWTTNPHIAKLLLNPKDGYTHSRYSSAYLYWKCPSCGNPVYHKSVSNVFKHGLVCKLCSDHISYPNKFISSLLQVLSIVYISEHSFPWSKNPEDPISKTKVYDFYLPDYNLILEAHGIQHYQENGLSKKRSLEEEQANDECKKRLALQNGYNFMAIDCRVSDPNFIFTNLIKEGFFCAIGIDPAAVCLQDVSSLAEKSYVVECYHMWKSGKSIEDLMAFFHKSKSTIQNYIKRYEKISNKEE